jgi:hypothetical protein
MMLTGRSPFGPGGTIDGGGFSDPRDFCGSWGSVFKDRGGALPNQKGIPGGVG